MDDASQSTTASPDRAGDHTGKVIGGDFRLLRRLGQGGMGQVYLAEQLSLKRKVAVKLLRGDLAADPAALQRFQAEALAVARATHANIVQVYAVGAEGGLHFMALEYVEGKDLRDYLEKKGPPGVLVCINLIRQVAAALQRASELGIVHRDIKPENILITRKGEVKVADFGLSRIFAAGGQPSGLTQSGVAMGTPLYMSPEQVEGQAVDARTDIYSLGVSAYHLLAGHPPFRGQSAFEVALQHVRKEPVPLQHIRPDLPPELCAMVHRMMAKRPQDRYQTAQEIVRDLGRLRDVLVGVSAHLTALELGPLPLAPALSGEAATQPLAPPSRRRTRVAPAVAAFVLMLLAGIGLGWWIKQGPGPGPPTDRDAPADGNSLPAPADPLPAEEQVLLEIYKRTIPPEGAPTTPFEARTAWIAAAHLGLFYLNHDQLGKAETFFKELEATEQVTIKKYLGKLGQAMVLSLRDQHQQSNELFHNLLVKKSLPKSKSAALAFQRKLEFLNDPKELREMIARCLQRNYDNAPQAFPAALHSYRSPPAPVLRDKKEGKASQ